jgi:hypothetical protein
MQFHSHQTRSLTSIVALSSALFLAWGLLVAIQPSADRRHKISVRVIGTKVGYPISSPDERGETDPHIGIAPACSLTLNKDFAKV